jgi:hypothetical protein
MRRRIAVVGDTLSSGGLILDYEQVSGFRFHGHKAALLGNEAYCERCGSTGTLAKAGGPHRLHYHTTREAALDGDIVLCQCPTPPHVTASLAGESWCDDRAEEFTQSVIPLGMNGATPGRQPHRYDEQFSLLDAAGSALPKTYYTVFLPSGVRVHGVTDSQGRTGRHRTDSAQSIQIHLGHKEEH